MGIEEKIPDCIDVEKNVHKPGYLNVIYEDHRGMDGLYSVYWCNECGAVSIDVGVDGRLNRHVVPIQYPDLVKALLREYRAENKESE